MTEEEAPLVEELEGDQPLAGRRVAFLGKLGSLSRREAWQVVRDHGGVPVEWKRGQADLVVLGAEDWPVDGGVLADPELEELAARGEVEILSETQFWQRLGEISEETRLYTPAMLADLLGVPVALVRRWHRRGLITPVREVYRLPYFDFQEVAFARQLARLVDAGMPAERLERQLRALARLVPEVERPLAQFSLIVEGKDLLLRSDQGLWDARGQQRFDFEALERPAPLVPTLPRRAPGQPGDQQPPDLDSLLDAAAEADVDGRLELAAELYRAALMAGGPRSDICFQLADVLYRMGDLCGARERYYMAIELDDQYIEARANLGCVLAELGQHELAISALQGALTIHNEYADAHYHLARILDDTGRHEEAERHWRAFLDLAPNSPWWEEGRIRLEEGPRGH